MNAPDGPVRFVIVFVPGQPIQISGPLQDRMLCYAMLELAKDAVREFKTPLIQVPHLEVDPFKKV